MKLQYPAPGIALVLLCSCVVEYQPSGSVEPKIGATVLDQHDASLVIEDLLSGRTDLGGHTARVRCDGVEALLIMDPATTDDRLYVVNDLPEDGLPRYRIDTVANRPLRLLGDGTRNRLHLAVADVDRDGCDDYWVSGKGRGYLFSASFAPYLDDHAVSVVHPESPGGGMYVMDVDERGPTMVAVDTGVARVYTGNRNGFAEQLYPGDASITIAGDGLYILLDLDADGKLDIAELMPTRGGRGTGLSIYESPDTALLVRDDADRWVESKGEWRGRSPVAVDFDQDGREEIVVPVGSTVVGLDDDAESGSFEQSATFTLHAQQDEDQFGVDLLWWNTEEILLVGAWRHSSSGGAKHPACFGKRYTPDEPCIGDEGAVYAVPGPFEGRIDRPPILIEAVPPYRDLGDEMAIAWDHLIIHGGGETGNSVDELLFFPLSVLR